MNLHRRTIRHLRTFAAAATLCSSLLLAPGCEDDQVVTTTRNLDRPGPMTLACAGRVDAGITGLPLCACAPKSEAGVPQLMTDAGPQKSCSPGGTLYGFVANTARGEVALFQSSASGEALVDLDRASPGYGFIPIGSIPTDLESTDDGKRVISANSGSCDLSVIDVATVMKILSKDQKKEKAPYAGAISRIIPHTRMGHYLRARPQEIAIVPSANSACASATDAGAADAGAADAGASDAGADDGGTGACDISYRAYVTFPRCNLLAEIDLATGIIVRGLIINHDGFQVTAEPRCPAECKIRQDGGVLEAAPDLGPDVGGPDMAVDGPMPGDGPLDAGPPDASSALDSSAADQSLGEQAATDSAAGDGAKTTGVLPYSLVLREDGARLYVSSFGAGFISAVDIDTNSGAFSAARRIALSDSVATSRIKLSPKTRMADTSNPSAQGRFIYAIARDRSVRVISADLEKECETNIDLASMQEVYKGDAGVPLAKAGCFVVGAKDTPPRRALMKQSGFRFGNRLPREVAFMTPVPRDSGTGDLGSTPMNGVFALIAVSDGTIYVVDLEDRNVVYSKDTSTDAGRKLAGSLPVLRLPHRFRNLNLHTSEGKPDAAVISIQQPGNGGIPVVVSEEVVGGNATSLPGEGVFLRAPGEAVNSTWQLVYERRLMGRWSGNLKIEASKISVDDRGANFCQVGVLGRQIANGRSLRHGDIVEFVGCKDDKECGLNQICSKAIKSESELGLCFDKDREDELFSMCKDFISNDREYVVTRAAQDELTLGVLAREPQKILLQASQPAGGCTDNADCDDYFLCALTDRSMPTGVAVDLKKGQCFRPGCVTSADCGASGFCVLPLDGSPRVCSSVPLPIEVGGKCTSDIDCDPASGLGATCEDNRDCKDQRTECRRASTLVTGKTCVDKGMTCASFPGLKDLCVRRSPCFQELLRYDVRVGRSFLIGGYSRVTADPVSSECKEDTTKSPLLGRRVPVGLPIYPAILGPVCQKSITSFLQLPVPNPCFERATHGYRGYSDKGGSSDTKQESTGPSTIVRYSNPDVAFGLGVSHLASFPKNSAVDAGAGASRVLPMPERGLTIQLEVNSGFVSLKNGTSALSLPNWLVEGPDDFIYVVDIGDQSGSTGSRGQVIRLERTSFGIDNFTVR